MKQTTSMMLVVFLMFTTGCASTVMYHSSGGEKYEYRGTYSIHAIDRAYRDGQTLVLQVTGVIPGQVELQPYEVRIPLVAIHEEYLGGKHLSMTPVDSISHKPKEYKPHVYGNDKKIALTTDAIVTRSDMSLPEAMTAIRAFKVPSGFYLDGISTRTPLLKELRAGSRTEGTPAIYFAAPDTGGRVKNNTFIYVDEEFLWDGENFITFTLPAVMTDKSQPSALLWPLAVIWDVVTFPVQLVYALFSD